MSHSPAQLTIEDVRSLNSQRRHQEVEAARLAGRLDALLGVAHHVVAKVTHDNSTHKAGFALVVYEKDTANVLARTGSSWKAISATALPTFTFGYVVRQLIAEAQDRLDILPVTTSFTDTHDTSGAPFDPIVGDFAVKVGDTLLSVLEQAAEFGVEWQIDGRDTDATLSMWVTENRGAQVDAYYRKGVNVARMVRSRKL